MSAKSTLGRKAATSVVKHSVHGTVSKAKRQPARAARLLALGALGGGVAGFLAGRRAAPAAAVTVVPPTTPRPAPVPAPDTAAAAAAVATAAASSAPAPLPPPD